MALISKSKSYILSAWRNNQIRLKATQGEGGIKSAQFVLTDDNGKIDLSTASSVLYNATKHDGSACSINCEIIDAVNGIISFTIESGITDVPGEVRGSIEVTADNGNVKFDGITVFVEKDAVGELIEASDSFSALTDALNKVSNLTPEGSVALDEVLTDDGVNPASSGVVKQYVDNVSEITKSLFLKQSSTQLIKLADNITKVNDLTIIIKNNHISIKGDSGADSVHLPIKIEESISKFEAGKNYTVSFQNVRGKTIGQYDGIFVWSGSDNNNKHILLQDKDSSAVINTATDKEINLIWNLSAGEWNKEFDFKIEYGTEATPFEPYYVVTNLENSSVTIGKLAEDVQQTINSKAIASQFIEQSKSQLIKLIDTEFEANGLNISIKNNHVHIKGTTTSSLNSSIKFDEGIKQFEAGVDYTASVQNLVTNTNNSGLFNIYLCKDTESNEYKSVRVNTSDSSTTFSLANTENVTLAWNLFASESVPQTFDVEFDFKIELGAETTPFEPYYVVNNIKNNSISFDKLNDQVINKLESINNKASYYQFKDITDEDFTEPVEIETGYYYGIFTHNTTAGFECTSTPIKCKEGDIFRITSATTNSDNHQAVVKCYDKNQTLISSHLEGSGSEIKTFTDKIFVVPKNVAYIAFNCRTTYNDVKIYSLKVEKAIPYTDEYGLLTNTLVSSLPFTELFGKSIYSDGDSIAQGTGTGNRSYAYLLADKYNMTLTSKAVGNTTLAVHPDNANITDNEGNPSTSICERVLNNISSDTQYDVIILDGGTNDITKGIPLGTITDGVDEKFNTSTILGALETICKHLNITQLTAKKLFVFTTNRVEKLKFTKEVNAEMKKVLNKWGFSYIDLSVANSLGHWDSNVAKDYYATIKDADGNEIPDPLHPNLEGHRKFYLPYIEKALLYGSYGGSGGSTTSVSLTDGDKDEIVAQVIEALPDDTVGISDTNINSNGELVITYTDNSSKNLGTVVGEDGKDGINGQDGISCTHSWSGTTLEITSASGTSSVDLKGEKGDSYILTDTDKTEIADIIKNEYESELLEILGGDENVAE